MKYLNRSIPTALFCVLLLPLLLLLFPGCSDSTQLQTEPPTPPDISVETPFCTLYYPADWDEAMRHESTASDYECTVSFYGTAKEQEVLLYCVYFAAATENSTPLGTLQTSDGFTVDVSIELFDFTPASQWEAEDTDLICGMQEPINHITEKLRENPDFTPA